MSLFNFSFAYKFPKIFLGMALVILIFLGMIVHSDYGLSSDEPVERNSGLITLKYLGERFKIDRITQDPAIRFHQYLPPLNIHFDRDYPVAFNLPVVVLERLLHIGDDGNEQAIYYFRHFFTFFVNLVGIIAIYFLAKRRFNDWRIGLLAVSFLVLSPRFFAESFYNGKDVVFMSFFALATYTSISFILQPTWRTAILHGLASALAIDLRIMAVVIPAMTILLVCVRIFRSELLWRKTVILLITYFCIVVLAVIIWWPWLWAEPWDRFMQAFQNMSNFSRGPKELLYLGEIIKTAQLPWHYVPVWIAITTPLLYIALFFVGIFATMKSIVFSHWQLWHGEKELQDFIFLGLFVTPIFAVVMLKSNLYDGWRQMYFVYPAFLLLAIKGWMILWGTRFSQIGFTKLLRVILGGILFTSFTWTMLWMAKAHPLENVYFNMLAIKNWHKTFDVDYWGLSHRMALEYILKENNSSYISVWNKSYPKLGVAIRILNMNDRQRLIELEKKDDYPDYIISTYRLDPTDYATDGKYDLDRDIKVGNETIASIFRIKEKMKPAIHLDEIIYFAKSPIGRSALRLPGWSHIESWGVWSEGKQAKVILNLPQGLPKTLVIKMRAFITPTHPNQIFELWVNGKKEQDITLTQALNNQIIIPIGPTIIDSGSINLEFKLKNPARPKDEGMGSDSRFLAIGLESAVFH